MKQFFAFVQKEFYHIIRDARTLLILLGMPIVEMLIFGFALNMEVSNVRTMIFDQSNDAMSRSLSTTIAHNAYFDLVSMAHSYEEIDDALRRGEIDLAIVLPSGMQKDLVRLREGKIQVIADATDPNVASIASSYVGAVLEETFGPEQAPAYSIETNTKMLYNPLLKSSYNFVPGLMGLVLVIICVIMTSVSIVREKERGSMEVLLSSPVKPIGMVLAKTVPYFVISFINLASILLLSYFVLHVPIRGSLLLIIGLTLIYIFLSLCLGMFISTIVKTQVEAILLSGFGMMMPTLVLSGMIFPISNMPTILQWLTYPVPARWFIDAIKRVMIQGLGLGDIWLDAVILIAMSAVLFILSVANIKPRLR